MSNSLRFLEHHIGPIIQWIYCLEFIFNIILNGCNICVILSCLFFFYYFIFLKLLLFFYYYIFFDYFRNSVCMLPQLEYMSINHRKQRVHLSSLQWEQLCLSNCSLSNTFHIMMASSFINPRQFVILIAKQCRIDHFTCQVIHLLD